MAESSADDEERLARSSSTRQRRSHYDSQRTATRSTRPPSGESFRPKTKRVSYQDYDSPPDWKNVEEPPLPPRITLQDEQERIGRADGLKNRLSASKGKQAQHDPVELDGQPSAKTSYSKPSSSFETSAQKRILLDDERRGYADDEDQVEPALYSQRLPEDYVPARPPLPEVSRVLTQLYAVSYLILFAILGTLARLGVQWLTFYPGAPIVTPVVWANFAGSMFMGFLSEDQRLFSGEWMPPATLGTEKRMSNMRNITTEFEELQRVELGKRKKTIPLYIGLATGFCGSFTSFSSFARDALLALSNDLPTPIDHPYADTSAVPLTSNTVPRNGGYSFMAWAAVVITTLALSLGGLILGAHIASASHLFIPQIPTRFCRRFLDPVTVLLGWASWLGAILLCIWPPDRPNGPVSHNTWANETWRGEVLFALAFAPVGCLLRFYASAKLNGLVPAFPLGTFAVNMLGTAVEGMCWDVQHVGVGLMGSVGGGVVGCQVLQGVMDGFCGTLTTVSTWVMEIEGLGRRHGYGYAAASVLGGLGLTVVVMGSVRWSVGWSEPVCSTGYASRGYG